MAKTITEDLNIPLEYSGDAQLLLFTRYGDPRDPGFEAKWLIDWDARTHFPWLPKKQLCLHKHFIPMLEKAFNDLQILNLHTEIKSIDGHHAVRMLRGSKGVLSVHSWGAAIDLNAPENPLGGNGKWSADFIRVMVNNNIYCGQNWIGRKDPMHFAMVNG